MIRHWAGWHWILGRSWALNQQWHNHLTVCLPQNSLRILCVRFMSHYLKCISLKNTQTKITKLNLEAWSSDKYWNPCEDFQMQYVIHCQFLLVFLIFLFFKYRITSMCINHKSLSKWFQWYGSYPVLDESIYLVWSLYVHILILSMVNEIGTFMYKYFMLLFSNCINTNEQR